MKTKTTDSEPKVGLLVEDADAIEVVNDKGEQSIQKTADREATAKRLTESGRQRPIHKSL